MNSTQIPQDPIPMPEEAFHLWLKDSLENALAALRA
jgi:hypothetical protein